MKLSEKVSLFTGGIISRFLISCWVSTNSTNYIPHPKEVDPGDVALSIMNIETMDLDSTGIKEPYLVYDNVVYRLRFKISPRGVYLEKIGNSDILK